MGIEELTKKINELDVEDRKRFDHFLEGHLDDRRWCGDNGIDYVNHQQWLFQKEKKNTGSSGLRKTGSSR